MQAETEFKEFEPRLKYGWFHLKLYSMFQDLSRLNACYYKLQFLQVIGKIQRKYTGKENGKYLRPNLRVVFLKIKDTTLFSLKLLKFSWKVREANSILLLINLLNYSRILTTCFFLFWH